MTEEEINSPKTERTNIPPPKVLVHQASEPDKSENNLEEHPKEPDEAGADPHDMIEDENPPKASPETGESTLRKDSDSPIPTNEKDSASQIESSESTKEDVGENGKNQEDEKETNELSQPTDIPAKPKVVSDSAGEVQLPEENKDDKNVTHHIDTVVADGQIESDVLADDGLAHPRKVIDFADITGSDDVISRQHVSDLPPANSPDKSDDQIPADLSEVTTLGNEKNTKEHSADPENDENNRKKTETDIKSIPAQSEFSLLGEIVDETDETRIASTDDTVLGEELKIEPGQGTGGAEKESENNNNQKNLEEKDTSSEKRHAELPNKTISEFSLLEEIVDETDEIRIASTADTVLGEGLSNAHLELEDPSGKQSPGQISESKSATQDTVAAISDADQDKPVTESRDDPSDGQLGDVEKIELTKDDSNVLQSTDISSTRNEPSSQEDEQNEDQGEQETDGTASKLSNASEKSDAPTVVEHEVAEGPEKPIRKLSVDESSQNLTKQLEEFQENAYQAEKARVLIEEDNSKLREEIQRLEKEKSGQALEMDELRLRLERLTKDDQDNVQHNKKLTDEVQTLKEKIAKLQQNLDHHKSINNGNSNMVDPSKSENKKSSVCTIL